MVTEPDVAFSIPSCTLYLCSMFCLRFSEPVRLHERLTTSGLEHGSLSSELIRVSDCSLGLWVYWLARSVFSCQLEVFTSLASKTCGCASTRSERERALMMGFVGTVRFGTAMGGL